VRAGPEAKTPAELAMQNAHLCWMIYPAQMHPNMAFRLILHDQPTLKFDSSKDWSRYGKSSSEVNLAKIKAL
jgi:hypothetical protein